VPTQANAGVFVFFITCVTVGPSAGQTVNGSHTHVYSAIFPSAALLIGRVGRCGSHERRARVKTSRETAEKLPARLIRWRCFCKQAFYVDTLRH